MKNAIYILLFISILVEFGNGAAIVRRDTANASMMDDASEVAAGVRNWVTDQADKVGDRLPGIGEDISSTANKAKNTIENKWNEFTSNPDVQKGVDTVKNTANDYVINPIKNFGSRIGSFFSS